MKIEIKNDSAFFHPIDLNITIESIEELRELAMRLNLSYRKANDFGLLEDDIHLEDGKLYDLFNIIHEKYKTLT